MYSNEFKIEARKLREDGWTYSEIASKFKISRFSARTLCTYSTKPTKKKTGPKRKIDKKISLRIKREIATLNLSKCRVTSKKIRDNLKINACLRTVQIHLKKAQYLYKKATKSIALTREHKEKRVLAITTWIQSNVNWSKVIFSDEKRFSFDGPDNWSSYVPKNKTLMRYRRPCGGGSVMVWMMLMPNGLLSYKIIDGTFNSMKYIELLCKFVVPIMKLNFSKDFVFQEDNSPVHKSKIVREFFDKSNIAILDWPAKSPDISIIEDVWRYISDKVYDGPIYSNKQSLKDAIKNAIFDLNTNGRHRLLNLYADIRPRLCKVLTKNGNLYNKPV